MEFILFGIISGVITGLGMGGGNLLVLALVTFAETEQHVAQAINLLFFIPTAIIAILIHIKNKNIEKKIAKKLFIPCIIGSTLGSYFTTIVSSNSLRKYFGVFLLIIRDI